LPQLQSNKKFNYNIKYFFLFIHIDIQSKVSHINLSFSLKLKMRSILSNQQLINEINGIKDNYIQSRPHMQMSAFKGTRQMDNRTNKYDRAEQPRFLGGGSPAFKSHPLSYAPPGGSTVGLDPLFSGVVDRPTPRGGAMLKRHMPLNCEESESDEEGGGYGDPDSSDYDSDDCGGRFGAETAKKTYSTMSKKSQDAIAKLAPYAKEISKKLTSPMALKIGASGLSILLMAIASSYVGPYVSKAIMPAITAKVFQISADVSDGIMSLASAKKEVKKAVDEAKERMVDEPSEVRTETTYGTTEEPTEGMGLKHFGRRKKASEAPVKGGKINKIVGTKRGNNVRGAIVAELMKKHGMKLGEASKYAKVHGLY
jgi:hypothetical protein